MLIVIGTRRLMSALKPDRLSHRDKVQKPMNRNFAALSIFLALSSVASAQSLKTINNQPPDGSGIEFLLTDGTVMTQGNQLVDWYKLTPDNTGSYVRGTWSKLASIPAAWGYVPSAFSSAVLADGRLLIVGGEYNNGNFALTNLGAIYDPVANSWAQVQPPANWPFIGDSPALVLPDGRFLIGRKTTGQVAALNPATLTWTELAAAGKADFNAEEGWTLMPDGTVLTADVKDAPNSERYIPSMGQWVSDGSTIVDLHSPPTEGGIPYGPGLIYYPPGEIGPAILRPDGSVFYSGASNSNQGKSSIYRPGAGPTDPGTWTVGPDFPNDAAGDSSAVLLPSGNVLVLGNSGTLYEFNGTTLTPGPNDFFSSGNMMLLPSGQAILTGSPVKVYNSTGTYSPAWAPTITTAPTAVTRGSSYTISGTQFNGLSQAAAFGDEFQTATNYPLVRIVNAASGHVVYARTHDHSTMGVATGSTIVSTHFDVPAGTETGESFLHVVANGIPSKPVTVTVN